MKRLPSTIAAAAVCLLLTLAPCQAQQETDRNNIVLQPAWGPSGYDYAAYYYFPDLNIYYDVNKSLFYYLRDMQWMSSRYLPEKYRAFDFYELSKVVVDDRQPWLKNRKHRKQYGNSSAIVYQTVIRDDPDNKYRESRRNAVPWVPRESLL